MYNKKEITLAAALLSKIHPPLPLNPQESRRLLQRLNVSFQKRIDTVSPFRLEDSTRHTQSHLQSILSNPLFKGNLKRRLDIRGKSQHAGAFMLHGVQYWMKEPLGAFQRGVSTGTATLDTAKLCLGLMLRRYVHSSHTNRNLVTGTAGTGSSILNWLWSSGMEESGQYLKDREFISLLVPFLVLEHRYDVIFTWFSRYQIGNPDKVDGTIENDHLARSAELLWELVRWETLLGAGFGASMIHFTEYSRRNSSRPISIQQKIFGPAGRFLAYSLAKSNKPTAVPEDILLSFIETSLGWSDEKKFAHVVLQIHNPRNPRPSFAVKYLRRLSLARLESYNAQQRASIIRTSLKAAELLLAEDREADALWIMAYIESYFAEDIGAKVSDEKSSIITMRKSNDEEASKPGPLGALASQLRVHACLASKWELPSR